MTGPSWICFIASHVVEPVNSGAGVHWRDTAKTGEDRHGASC